MDDVIYVGALGSAVYTHTHTHTSTRRVRARSQTYVDAVAAAIPFACGRTPLLVDVRCARETRSHLGFRWAGRARNRNTCSACLLSVACTIIGGILNAYLLDIGNTAHVRAFERMCFDNFAFFDKIDKFARVCVQFMVRSQTIHMRERRTHRCDPIE